MSIAEDIVNGLQCSECGICFAEDHGYPVLCDDCWKEAVKEGRVKKGKSITTDGKQQRISEEL